MKNLPATPFILFLFSLVITTLSPSNGIACTIVSAIGVDGQVWNANNEDGHYGVANFINVFPRTAEGKYGYYTLSYFSPALGKGGSMQGGMNEAGLTFDFNAISPLNTFDPGSKEPFPAGDDAILPHILANMGTVQEVMEFFRIYWFQNGFMGAQMHVADWQGRFAIISASGMYLAEIGKPLVSTNFDICGKEDSASCWRYPLATSMLENQEVNFNTMKSICLETAQKNGSTMYSNIQNLSTGEIWLFSKHDPANMVHIDIPQLLSKGRKSYSFRDLNALYEDRPEHEWIIPERKDLPANQKAKYIGAYHNSFSGYIQVDSHEEGIEISLEDGTQLVLHAATANSFFMPEEDVTVEFNEEDNLFNMYENGFWTITAWKKESLGI